MNKKLILIGGGGHCKSCIDVIEQAGLYEISGIIDKPENIGQSVLGYEVIGKDEHIEELASEGFDFFITVGHIRTSQIRQNLFNELLRCNASIATIISPRAYVSKHAVIEKGTIIMHDALINTGAHIGENCIINSKALVEHDVEVGRHCHISTGSIVNGGVVINEGCFWGSNATSKESIVVGANCFVKAGSVVK
ncbi:MAG: acetyltransferase [Helicobacteraceae bacterium]|nr:acetyltransferase [Helicobacteraceae bacterium]